MDPAQDPAFAGWLRALEERHLSDLRFAEVRRGVEALSRRYVERRHAGSTSLGRGALDGRGKRAAFALFYGPLHYLVVRHIVDALGLAALPFERIVDLGCGTGAAAAAWAHGAGARPSIVGVEAHAWAVSEARSCWRSFGLAGRVRVGDLLGFRLPGRGAGILAAFVVNELEAQARDELLERLRGAGRRGAAILVVEPIARAVAPWWDRWAEAFRGLGGRADEWRFPGALPDLVARLDRAAGLDHRELTARTLSVVGPGLTERGHGA